MKIELNRDILAKKLGSVSNGIGSNQALPIVSNILFEFDKGRLFLEATDMQVSISTSMDYELVDGKEASFICDGTIILKTISTLKSDTVWIDFDEEKKSLTFGTKSTRKKYLLPCNYEVGFFPRISGANFSEEIELGAEFFATAVKTCSTMTNKSDLRQVFNGVYIGTVDSNIRIAGTDSFVIAVYDFPAEKTFEGIIIPRDITKVIPEIEKSPTVKISHDKLSKALRIDDGNIIIKSVTIDAKYPDLNVILGNINTENFVKVSKVEFEQAITRSKLFQNRQSCLSALDFTSKEVLSIQSEDIDFSKSATEQLEVIETSDSMRFKSGANADFLFKLVKVLTGETITISQNSEKSLLSITDEVERAYKITLAMSPMFIN
jgi:DNA polymerase-3 subunit beta